MLSKAIIFMFLLIATAQMAAQNKTPKKTIQKGNAQTQTYSGGFQDTCLDKKFSVVFYVINDSAFSRKTSDYNPIISNLLSFWNAELSRICVSFESCSTVLIPNYEFNAWTHPKTDQAVIKDWYTDKTINVYLPDIIEMAPGNESGAYAYVPQIPSAPPFVPLGTNPGSLSVIVVEHLNFQGSPTLKIDALHAIGHFLGLPDTFAETGIPASPTSTHSAVSSTEFVDGSNSNTNGDRFADTEADCFPAGLNSSVTGWCGYGRNVTDGKNVYYSPPVDNYMSKWLCACRFTQQQYNYMAWFIMNYRLNLH